MKATVHRMFEAWKRRESMQQEAELRAVQHIGRYPIIELADPPRNPDGTRSEWSALLDAKPRFVTCMGCDGRGGNCAGCHGDGRIDLWARFPERRPR